MRRMVISTIVTVGNYEYGYYWYLYQDGSIEYEVKLTGVHLQRRRSPTGEHARARHDRRPRRLRPAPPALLQRPAGHGGRRHREPRLRGHPDARCPRARTTRVGNAWRADEVLHRRRGDGPSRGRPARPAATGRSSTPERQERARPAGRLQARPRAHHQVVRPPGVRRRPARGLHRPPRSGSPPTTGTRSSPPATTRTSPRAAAACPPSSRPAGTSPTPTSCSGSPSAPTTSSARRTGRSCRSTRSASGCSRPASSSATPPSTTPSPAATLITATIP